MAAEKRQVKRVVFARGIPLRIIALDGTSYQEVMLLDISDEGARLSVDRALVPSMTKEFFLVLTSSASAYRRCVVIWINGTHVGCGFKGRRRAQTSLRARPLRWWSLAARPPRKWDVPRA